ncbi:hypothetical protein [Streptomyces sp. NA04227]|uniref:hypothetical protein n=1 Tax=Streptomyces sp. NA04227 TaxID=2742136 RepID=UPI0020CA42BD|nr:hypothetical protein [Streptomyces sp. NA04227]
MQADASFWDSLVVDGIDDVDVEAVTFAFGTVDARASLLGSTTSWSASGSGWLDGLAPGWQPNWASTQGG